MPKERWQITMPLTVYKRRLVLFWILGLLSGLGLGGLGASLLLWSCGQ